MKSFSEQVKLADLITSFDLLTLLLILFLTLLVVILGNKRNQAGTEQEKFIDYMLMSRKLSLPMFIGTLVATWYGGIFGVTEIAFENGLYNFVTQGVFWYATYLIFAFFLVERIKSYEALTLPELVGFMFGKKARFIASIFNFFNVVPITYTISLGILIHGIFSLDFFLLVS